MQILSVFAAVYMRKTPSGVHRLMEPPRGTDRGRVENVPSLHAVSLFKKRPRSPTQIYGTATLYRRLRQETERRDAAVDEVTVAECGARAPKRAEFYLALLKEAEELPARDDHIKAAERPGLPPRKSKPPRKEKN